MTKFKKGDHVRWNTPQGETTGHVVDIRTHDFQHQKQHFTASDDDPAYIVESDKSGKQAAHKESGLSGA